MSKKNKSTNNIKANAPQKADVMPEKDDKEMQEPALPLHLYIAQNLKRNSLAISVVIAVFFLLGLLFMYTNKFSPITFIGKEFSTSATVGQSMTVTEDSGINGVFTYGPYINIKKGDYKITVEYSSDTDIDFQVSSDYGVNNIITVPLPKDKTSYTFDAHIGSDVTDKSLELRTFYHGGGTFTLERVTINGASGGAAEIPFIIAYIISAAFCIYLFRHRGAIGVFVTAYIGFSALIMDAALSANPVGAILFAVGAMIFAFSVNSFYYNGFGRLESVKMLAEIVIALMAAYFFTNAFAIHLNDEKINTINYLKNVNRPMFIMCTAALFDLFMVIRLVINKGAVLRLIAVVSAAALSISMIYGTERSVYFTAGVIAVFTGISYVLLREINFEKLKVNRLPALVIVIIGFVLFTAFFGVQSVCRYKSFGASNFDFGIFAQMYEGILRTGLPVTTLERNELLSHFYIHFSPIFYLLVPVYFIFRSPQTLLVCQAALVGAGVFPIFFLCGSKNKNYLYALLISAVYLCMPCLIAPLYYDFHENAFLPVMLLSTVYFLESRQFKQMYIFAALSLLIKEDAAIYVLSIALYAIFANKQYKHGSILFIAAMTYFGIVMAGIAHFEKGLMSSHYGMYYLPGEKGVVTMFKNMFFTPGLVINTCFNKDTAEFILFSAGTLLFIPFVGKKMSRLWLAVPYLLINLVTSYGYQHDIGYQYVFGSASLLLVMFIINIFENKNENLRAVLASAAVVACICGTYTYKGDLTYYYKNYQSDRDKYDDSDSLLQRIPKDVSITAETFLAPHLYNYKDVYQYKYDGVYTDYYVLQSYVEDYAELVDDLTSRGYTKAADNGKVIIYKAKDAQGLK